MKMARVVSAHPTVFFIIHVSCSFVLETWERCLLFICSTMALLKICPFYFVNCHCSFLDWFQFDQQHLVYEDIVRNFVHPPRSMSYQGAHEHGVLPITSGRVALH